MPSVLGCLPGQRALGVSAVTFPSSNTLATYRSELGEFLTEELRVCAMTVAIARVRCR